MKRHDIGGGIIIGLIRLISLTSLSWEGSGCELVCPVSISASQTATSSNA